MSRARARAPLTLFVAACSVPAAGSAQERGAVDEPYTSCPTPDPERLSLSVHGMVTDERTGIPLPGATVRLVYEPSDGAEAPPAREATADGHGRYVLCNLVAFARVRLAASFDDRTGDPVPLVLEHPRRIDLEIDLGDPAYLVFSAVEAGTGAPIEGARVELSPLPLAGMTDSLGRVAFREVPPGEYRLLTRHIAYGEREESILVEEGQLAEMRVELATRAIAVEPLEVRVTGRDPYLLEQGFYERRETIQDGWFATKPDLEPYVMFRTLFRFKRELTVRYSRNQVIFIDGRPMERLGFDSVAELNELSFRRVRGIEAYHCSDAPPGLLIRFTTAIDRPLGDCHVVLIWTR